VLDLDETLVHSDSDYMHKPDITLKVNYTIKSNKF